MKHTWNTFKSKVKDLTKEQKEDLLQELHKTFITERTKGAKGNIKIPNLRLIRKQIAYLKTILHYEGFGYNPR